MPEFKVFTRIQAPYDKVWEIASKVGNIEKWSPVRFLAVAPEEEIKNGLNLVQVKKQFGLWSRKELFVGDAYTNSKVRRQYSFVDKKDRFGHNRITYMFDDNSISTMIALSEDAEAKKILKEQAKTEPEFQIDIMAHVYYSLGTNFWRFVCEKIFIAPFFRFIYEPKVKTSMAKFKELCES